MSRTERRQRPSLTPSFLPITTTERGAEFISLARATVFGNPQFERIPKSGTRVEVRRLKRYYSDLPADAIELSANGPPNYFHRWRETGSLLSRREPASPRLPRPEPALARALRLPPGSP